MIYIDLRAVDAEGHRGAVVFDAPAMVHQEQFELIGHQLNSMPDPDKIQSLREAAGMTQEQAAAAAKLPAELWAALEDGRKVPSAALSDENLTAVAAVLGVQAADLQFKPRQHG
jgi:DNA-binding XRE family transcriptional regulator